MQRQQRSDRLLSALLAGWRELHLRLSATARVGQHDARVYMHAVLRGVQCRVISEQSGDRAALSAVGSQARRHVCVQVRRAAQHDSDVDDLIDQGRHVQCRLQLGTSDSSGQHRLARCTCTTVLIDQIY